MVIVYTSNSGYTKQYAEMLAKDQNIEMYDLKQLEKVPEGSEIIYMGWLMAGNIVGYKDVAEKYKVRAVVGVGMSPWTEALEYQLRDKTGVSNVTPLFYVQGGFDIKKLKGTNKLIMKAMSKKILHDVQKKASKTPDDELLIKMCTEGASAVSEDNFRNVLLWAKENVANNVVKRDQVIVDWNN